MIKNNTILFMLSLLALNACSAVGGYFSDDEKPPLEGERISVLELQKALSPDNTIAKGQEFVFPEPWANNAWPQSGGYPNHSMQNMALSGGSLKRVWSSDIGSGSTDNLPLNAPPIVANNAVFTLDTNSKLSAFDAQSGKRFWQTDVETDDENEHVVSGGISFAHNVLYVTNGYDEVLAVSAKDGSIIWRKPLPAPSRAAPTVIDGRVFVTTIDSRLVCLNVEDGSSIWEYIGIGEAAGLLGAASPAANSDIVVPVFSSGEITALRIENGSVAWSDNLSSIRKYGGGLESLSDIKALPILDRGMVIAISFAGKLVAIDERSGARVWQREISGAQTPWIAGNHLYLVSSENQLIALNVVDGTIFWIQELQNFENEKKKEDPITWNGPVLANGRLVVAGSHGEILEINAHHGDIMRTIKVKKDIAFAPVIANETMYILAEDGSLMAYR